MSVVSDILNISQAQVQTKSELLWSNLRLSTLIWVVDRRSCVERLSTSFVLIILRHIYLWVFTHTSSIVIAMDFKFHCISFHFNV